MSPVRSKAQERLRHSHPFEVLVKSGGPWSRHTFSHIHECDEGDGHTHRLTTIDMAAWFPLFQHVKTADKGKQG